MAEENNNLANEVAEAVFSKIANTFADFMDNIKDGQKGITESLDRINNRLELAEEKARKEELIILDHEKRLKEKKSRILKLEEGYEENKRVIRIIDKLEPALLRVDNAFKWWKIALYIIALAVLVFAAVAFSHRHGLLGQYKSSGINNSTVKTQQYSNITRAVHEKKLSDAQIDSVELEILSMIKPIPGMRK